MAIHQREDVNQCIAQARHWAASPDNGWAPRREQVAVLADEVERLRALVDGDLSDAVAALAITVDSSPGSTAAVIDRFPGLAHGIDRVTRFADPPVDVYRHRTGESAASVLDAALTEIRGLLQEFHADTRYTVVAGMRRGALTERLNRLAALERGEVPSP